MVSIPASPGNQCLVGSFCLIRKYKPASFIQITTELIEQWLCHADARQVFALPKGSFFLFRVCDPIVGKLPVIDQRFCSSLFRKSQTCRASDGACHCIGLPLNS